MSNLTDRLGGARASLAFKAPCRVATTANITLSGYQTIDGVTIASSDADNGYNTRVLVKNQTTASENGIYEPATGAWARARDCDGSDDIRDGTRVFVAQGTTQSGGYVFTTDDPVTIGTSNITIVSQSTVDVSFGSLDELTVVDPDEDSLVIVDASAGATKRVEPDTLMRYNSNGTIAAPAIAFESDADTGMYRAGPNELGFSVGGAGSGLGLSSTSLYPVTSNTTALGTAALMFSDLSLASGAVINFNAGDVTITHAANALAFAGASSGYTFDAAVQPASNDGAALGGAANRWSDVYVADGAVISFNNDILLTHSTDLLAFTGGAYSFDGAVRPSADDAAALGSAAASWADLFLASGAVINFNNSNYTLTHSAGALTAAGGPFTAPSFIPSSSSVPSNGLYLPASNTLGWAINSAAELQLTATALSPAADGGSSLGTTALGWQNLFANTGFVLNIENNDWIATHSAGILTIGTGDLRIGTAGTNSTSAVTVGGMQTLTAKTLNLASNTLTGTLAEFNTALSDANFASLAGSESLSNKTIVSGIATGTFDIQQGWKLSGDYPDTWAGDQDNYNGGGDLENYTIIRVDGGAGSRNMTGMTGGSDGLIRIFQNVGATNNIVIKNETTSTAANRFALGSDITLAPNQGAILRYDGTLSRWTAIGVFTSGGAGSGTVTSVAQGFGMNFSTITTSGSVALNAGFSAAISGAM